MSDIFKCNNFSDTLVVFLVIFDKRELNKCVINYKDILIDRILSDH